MKSLFQSFILRDLRKNALRSGLTIAGIALGVAVLLAINLANQSVLSNFRQSIDVVSGKANLEIRPRSLPSFEEGLLRQLHWVWLVGGHFTPVIEQTAVLPGKSQEVLQVFGLDMLADSAFRSYTWEFQGKPPAPFTIFQQRQAFVGEALATAHGWQVGDPIQLLINDRLQTLRIAGILSQKGIGGAYSGNLLLMDIASAQEAFGMGGRISRIDLIFPEEKVREAQGKLTQDLPQTLLAERPQQRGEQVEKMLRAFQYNLTALSFISLLVGMFLIYNTMSISVLRRRPDIGTLRAVGASKQHIFVLFGLEAAALGLVGTLLGLGIGIGMAKLALHSVSQTVQSLYVAQAVSDITVPGWVLGMAFLLGMGMTLVAALPPILEATSVSPAEATRRRSDEIKAPRYAGRLALVGLGLWLLGLWAARQPAWGTLPLFGYLAALLAVLGGALLMPFLLHGLLRVIVPLSGMLLGAEGQLAGHSLAGTLGRTSVAVASLMTGIAMMISLAVMIGSFRDTVITWVNQSIRADLLVEPASRLTSKLTGRLTPEVVEAIRHLPGVKAVDAFFEFPIQYQGQPTNLGAGNTEVLMRYGDLQFTTGESTQTVLQRMIGRHAVVVTESFALKNHVNQGDWLTLPTPRGPLRVQIAGVYYDYTSEQGYIILSRALYRQYYQDDSVTTLAVYLQPGVSPATARQEMVKRVGPQSRLKISTQGEVRQNVLRIFDNTFSITYALHLIAIAVAILSVMNTLFALVMESKRDFGILRYLGASPGQIQKIVLTEAGILGLLGNLTGLGMGLILSLLLIQVINKQSFGWTLHFALPVNFLVQSFLLVMGTAILSGLIPAGMAARIPAPSVIREE